MNMAARIQPLENTEVSADIKQRFKTAEERGAPNSLLLRILARNPDTLRMFYDSWEAIFYHGIVDHGLKEIVRVRMARVRGCGY